jgi:hypothetical protein
LADYSRYLPSSIKSFNFKNFVEGKYSMMKIRNKVLYSAALVFLASIITSCVDTTGTGTDATLPTLQVVNTDSLALGNASTFAVFGGSAGVTNAGLGTVIVGDMGTTGISNMITGFHNSAFSYTETPLNIGAVTGTIYTDAPQGTVASKAIADATLADMQTAFDNIAAIPDGVDPGSGQLGGLTLTPGVYKAAGGAFLITGGDLTLDAGGDTSAVWVFQMASSLTVGDTAPRSVILTNGAQSRNVYWQVGSSATINGVGGGTMVGTIIASASITFSTAGNTTLTTLNGRALALNASITMVNSVINVYGSAVPLPVTPDPTTPHLVTSGVGTTVPVITLGGYIDVVNDSTVGAVAATMTGAGTMNINNAAGAGVLTATQTGNGLMTIGTVALPRSNTGVLTVTITGDGQTDVIDTGTGALTLTNTGNGPTLVDNSSIGAVTVTNTGNGTVSVTASGTGTTVFTHSTSTDVVATCVAGVCTCASPNTACN